MATTSMTVITLGNLGKYDELIKSYVANKVSDSVKDTLKSVALVDSTLKFYTVAKPAADTAPAFTIDLPETDVSALLSKITGATAGDVVIAKADGTIEDGKVKLADLATKEEIKSAQTPIATSKVAGKVIPGGDFDITSDGTISLYKYMSINSFWNNVNTVEKGRTITDVTLTWQLNKVPVTLTLDGKEIDVSSTNQSLSGLGLQADKTWTLKATDARNASSQKTTGVYFRNGRYWGVGTVDADGVDDTFVQGLTKELASDNSKTFTVNAGVGQYIYYVHPASFGTPVFNVGGFEGGFDLIKTFDYTNVSGFKESYKVWKSKNANLGNTTVVVK